MRIGINKDELSSRLDRLKEPFPADVIHFRVGQHRGGPEAVGEVQVQAMPYIDLPSMLDRLDEVIGPENWQNEFSEGPNGGVTCGISILIEGEWVTKWDGADNTDFEKVKGGLTDAQKRAMRQWGVGRYLYSSPKFWVAGERKKTSSGKFHVSIKEKPTLPSNLLPKKSAAQKPAEKKAETKAPAPAEKENPLLRALAYKIPEGVPLAGATLKEAVADAEFGPMVIGYLSGSAPNLKNENYKPEDKEGQLIMAAAKYIFDHFEEAKKLVATNQPVAA